MRWTLSTEGKSFEVSAPVRRKADFSTGEVKVDPSTKAPLWIVGVAVKDATGIELINVTVAGVQPELTVGQHVSVRGLEVGAYAMSGKNGGIRSGLWFRAESIIPVPVGKSV